jgi:hypothetical protein
VSPVVLISAGLLIAYVLLLRIDWTPGRYKIGFHQGSDLSLGARLQSGELTLSNDALQISGSTPLTVPFAAVEDWQVGPFQGAKRVFRLRYQGGELAIIVVRVMIARWFFIGDFFKAKRLESALSERL